jgi:hypothetical protein
VLFSSIILDIDECAIYDHDANFLSRYYYRYYNYDRGCMVVAICTNMEGGYNCSCPDGYTGDGRWFGSGCNGMHFINIIITMLKFFFLIHADINECAIGTHSCTANELCINSEGSFRCEYNAPSEGIV